MELRPKILRILENGDGDPTLSLLQIGCIFALRETEEWELPQDYFFASREEAECIFEKVKSGDEMARFHLIRNHKGAVGQVKTEWRTELDDEDEK